jgi:hypothetical protein
MSEGNTMETKRFPLRVLLTVTTERLLTKGKGPRDNGIGDLYELLGWMTDDTPFTHQLPRFNDECKPWLLRWFPGLQKANDAIPHMEALAHLQGPQGIESWLEALVAGGQPEWFDVPRIPAGDHTNKCPITELAEMRGGTDGIIALVLPAPPHSEGKG